jgi:hypothetical protein
VVADWGGESGGESEAGKPGRTAEEGNGVGASAEEKAGQNETDQFALKFKIHGTLKSPFNSSQNVQ